jgi:hypothetical protein
MSVAFRLEIHMNRAESFCLDINDSFLRSEQSDLPTLPLGCSPTTMKLSSDQGELGC